jgi:hypothetical protein
LTALEALHVKQLVMTEALPTTLFVGGGRHHRRTAVNQE